MASVEKVIVTLNNTKFKHQNGSVVLRHTCPVTFTCTERGLTYGTLLYKNLTLKNVSKGGYGGIVLYFVVPLSRVLSLRNPLP